MKRYKTVCPYCSTVNIPAEGFRGGEMVCMHCRRKFLLGPPPTDTDDAAPDSDPIEQPPRNESRRESTDYLLNAEKSKDDTTGFSLADGISAKRPGGPEQKRELSDDFLDLADNLPNIGAKPALSLPIPPSTSVPIDGVSLLGDSTGLRGLAGGEKTDPQKRERTNTLSATLTGSSVSASQKPLDNTTASRIQTISRIQEAKNKSEESVVAGSAKIWQVGQTFLGGKYRVVELSPGVPYAEGGVGIVHRVHHEEWDIDFAVKSPKPEFILSENGKVSFERECQTWIELGLHTNIVTCYLVRRIGGIPRVFAEFVGDGTLRDLITSGALYAGGERAALERILDISIQFARGLAHAHRQGLLHLDVKPGNVMMAGDVAKVTDFGLAKVVHQGLEEGGETDSASCEGMTPSYCSPEQYEAFLIYQREEKKRDSTDTSKNAASKTGTSSNNAAAKTGTSSKTGVASDNPQSRITRKSDIWSWAISILSMFHGRSPCKKGGQTAAEVFEIFLKIPPNGTRPAIPPAMVDLFRECFQKDPAKRPDSMDEIADRLVGIYEEIFDEKYRRPKPADTAFTAESFCNRAVSMLDLGKPVEAYNLINRAADMTSWHPQITYDRTLVAWRFGLLTDLSALHALEELTKHNNRDPFSHYALGLIQRERGNPKGAAVSFAKAREIDPDRPEYRKAYTLVKNTSSREAACVGRYLLKLEGSETPPAVYVDGNQDFCLLPTATKRFSLIAAATGLEAIGFRPMREPNSIQTALSEDYRREIVQQDGTLILKDSGPRTPEMLVGAAAALKPSEILTKIAWGKKEDAYNQKKSIRLTIRENVVDLYSVTTGKRVLSFKGHEHQITSLYVTPDGRWAATGSFDTSLRIWQVETGRCIRTFRGLSGSIDALWIDAKHRYVLTVIHETSLQLWNIDLLCNHTELTRAPALICVVSSSEEIARRQTELDALLGRARESAAAGDWKTVAESLHRAHDIDGWQTVRSELKLSELIGRHAESTGLDDIVSVASFQGHEEAVSAVALSADGLTGLSAGKDQTIRLWRFPKGDCLRQFSGHYDWIRSVDMTLDGRFAVSGSWDRSVRIWNLRDGTFIRSLDGSIRNIEKVRFAPDGRTIAVATGTGELSIWDGTTGDRIAGTSVGDAIASIQFSVDGRYLIAGADRGRMSILSTATMETVREFDQFKGTVNAVDLSADLRYAVGGDADGKILVFDLAGDGKTPVGRLTGSLDEITALTILSDNRRIASAAKDRTVRFWDMVGGKRLKTLEGYSGAVTDLAVDFGRSAFLTGGEDARLRYWNIYWLYDYPGTPIRPEAFERMLRVVTGRYLRLLDAAARGKSPAQCSGVVQEIEPDLNSISLDEKTVLKILTEMEYRGYGTMPREEIFEGLKKLLENWPGLLKL